jgi:hypothetical protein
MVEQKVTHKKGDIVNELVNAIEVNAMGAIPLDINYYVCDGRVYKKLKNGKFRALVKQDSRKEYQHYFFSDKNKKKLTLNANKLDLLNFNTDVKDMSLSSLAPSLELKLQKHKSTHLDNTSANTNTNSIVVNNWLTAPTDDVPTSPRPLSTAIPLKSPVAAVPKSPVATERALLEPLTSPSTSIIDKFKDLLIEYQTELLLNDYELICNIIERGKNIVMREQHLINIIKCLEPEVTDVEIDREVVQMSCIKCSCKNPLYYKITAITLNKTRDFTTSNYKVILQKQYNISLDFCI